jgi:hypothetical protein
VQNRKTNLSNMVILDLYAHAWSTAMLTNSIALAAHGATPCSFPCWYKSPSSQHSF